MRTVAALLFTSTAIFWGVFALGQLLVFEIADSVGGSYATASQCAAAAGLALLAVNMLAISATTGLFGRGAFARYLTEALLVAVIGASVLLYPTQTVAQGITRICIQFLDVLALSLAIAANYWTRQSVG
jgi:hypothetical protein